MLTQALRLYRISFLRCLPLAGLGALLAALAGAYASVQAHAVVSQVTALANSALATPQDAFAQLSQIAAALRSLWQSPAVWASYAAGVIVGLAFHGALIACQAAIACERRPQREGGAERAPADRPWLSRTLRRLPSLLAVVGLFAAGGACAALLLAASSASAGLALLLGVLLLILGTWLWGRLQLWLVAMFTQELSALEALRASWSLVAGKWWRVSSLITVPYLAVALVTWTGQLLAMGAGGAAAALTHTTLWGQVLFIASGALTLPMLPAAWLAIYGELSAKKTPPMRG